jgi:hypothetical protein
MFKFNKSEMFFMAIAAYSVGLAIAERRWIFAGMWGVLTIANGFLAYRRRYQSPPGKSPSTT